MGSRLPRSDSSREIRNSAERFGTGLFSVRETTGQSLAAGANRIVNFDTAEYNHDGWFDVTTYKYTPKRPGYYLFTVTLYPDANRTALATLMLMVNGNPVRTMHATASGRTLGGSCIYYLNGTTDYAQIAVNPVTDAFVLDASAARNWFQGVLISTKP